MLQAMVTMSHAAQQATAMATTSHAAHQALLGEVLAGNTLVVDGTTHANQQDAVDALAAIAVARNAATPNTDVSTYPLVRHREPVALPQFAPAALAVPFFSELTYGMLRDPDTGSLEAVGDLYYYLEHIMDGAASHTPGKPMVKALDRMTVCSIYQALSRCLELPSSDNPLVSSVPM